MIISYLSIQFDIFMPKEQKMDFKKNRVVMNEAVNSGCKTMGELALYLRLRRQLKAA